MPTWMVVEDEPDIFEVLAAMFEVWGVDGLSFVDGNETMAWIEAVDSNIVQDEMPELVLMDIRLPGHNGVQLAERLRKSDKLRKIAVVLMTAYRLSAQEEALVMQQTAANALIYKPLPKMAQFRQLLDSILEQSQKNGAA